MDRVIRIAFAMWMSASGLLIAFVLATAAFGGIADIKVGAPVLQLAELCLGGFGLAALGVSGIAWLLISTFRLLSRAS
jgi:hypothetical protein